MKSVKEWWKETSRADIIGGLVILLSTALLIIMASTGKLKKNEKVEIEETKKAEKLQIQSEADDIMRKIRYIQDPQTGICYAYCWHYGVDNTLTLTAVPCEKIPPELLVQTNPKN